MKVLIDECAPKALKMALAASGFDCTTVQEAGWSGKENGELLALADELQRDGHDRSESPLSAEPHRAQDRTADRLCALESCGGLAAALSSLHRSIANHPTGHGGRSRVIDLAEDLTPMDSTQRLRWELLTT